MKLVHISLLLVVSTMLAGAIAACGDDDDEAGGGDEPAATTPASDGGGEGNEVTIESKDFSFDPQEFSVPAGEPVTITLENTGSAPHTLTVYTDNSFETAIDGADTENVDGGESGEFTATFEAGEYHYRCEVHPAQMTGEIDAE